MNSKVLVVVLIVLAAVGAFFLMPSTPSIAFDTSYSQFLPDSTKAVVGLNSMDAILSTTNTVLAKFPQQSTMAKQGSVAALGFDALDAKSYADKGFDLNKPLGFAVLGEDPPMAALFIGATDTQKLDTFLKERLKVVPQIKLEAKTIGSTQANLVKMGQAIQGIYCYKNDYFVFYRGFGPSPNIEELFGKHIDAPTKTLAQNEKYVKTLTGLGENVDTYMYLDIKDTMGAIVKAFPPAEQVIKEAMSAFPEGLHTVAAGLAANKQELKMVAYSHTTEELITSYQTDKNCADVLANFPANPLAVMTYNQSAKATWEEFKKQFNKNLKDPRTGPQLSGMLGGNSVEAIFKRVEEQVKQGTQGAVEVNLEQDLILNMQGNAAFALYNLPSQDNMTFDAMAVLKLNDSAKIADLLKKIVELEPIKQQGMVENLSVADSTAYVINLPKVQEQMGAPVKATPTIGIFKDYLFIATTKELYSKVAKGESSGLLADPIPANLVDGMKKGDPSVGYMNIKAFVSEVMSKLVPPPVRQGKEAKKVAEALGHFTTAQLHSTFDVNGGYGMMSVQTDTDILTLILDLALEMKKMQEQMMPRPQKGQPPFNVEPPDDAPKTPWDKKDGKKDSKKPKAPWDKE